MHTAATCFNVPESNIACLCVCILCCSSTCILWYCGCVFCAAVPFAFFDTAAVCCVVQFHMIVWYCSSTCILWYCNSTCILWYCPCVLCATVPLAFCDTIDVCCVVQFHVHSVILRLVLPEVEWTGDTTPLSHLPEDVLHTALHYVYCESLPSGLSEATAKSSIKSLSKMPGFAHFTQLCKTFVKNTALKQRQLVSCACCSLNVYFSLFDVTLKLCLYGALF